MRVLFLNPISMAFLQVLVVPKPCCVLTTNLIVSCVFLSNTSCHKCKLDV